MKRWVVITEYVQSWIDQLDTPTVEQLFAALELLSREGPHLGRPFVDRIHGSQLHNLKELRVGSTGPSEIRVLFIFDSARQAVLLIGGDKSHNWKAWYHRKISRAELIYEKYLEELNT